MVNNVSTTVMVTFNKQSIVKTINYKERKLYVVQLPITSQYSGYTFLVDKKYCVTSHDNPEILASFFPSQYKVKCRSKTEQIILTSGDLKKEFESSSKGQITLIDQLADILKRTKIEYYKDDQEITIECELKVKESENRLKLFCGENIYESKNPSDLISMILFLDRHDQITEDEVTELYDSI